MVITNKLKERFTKDYKIPIKVYDEPYFSSLLKLFDKQYDAIRKYELFKNELDKYNTEDEYFEYYRSVKENIMNYIKNNPNYIRFNNYDLNSWALPVMYNQLPSKDIYKPTFIGKRFLSIDMVKANFNSLKHVEPKLFDSASTWEEFIRKFTDSEYIINSKYIREVIFGNCNCSRQMKYEKYLMGSILKTAYKDWFNIVYFSNDEIILDITDLTTDDIDKVKNLFINAATTIEIPIRLEVFTLKAIYNNNTIIGYLKVHEDGTFDIKKYSNIFLPAIIKTIYNKPIEDTDLVFNFDNNLSMLLNKPNITIKETYNEDRK